MPPGSKVLYLGAASGTTVSHVSDIVGPVCDLNSYRIFQRDCLLIFFRKVLFLQLNSHIVQVEIS